MMKIVNKKGVSDRKDVFEVVEKIPDNYQIWNIGDNMEDGYIPLCVCDDEYTVQLDSLKAIKIEDEKELELLRECASYGVHNLKSAKKTANIKNPDGYLEQKAKFLAEKSIEIFERLTEMTREKVIDQLIDIKCHCMDMAKGGEQIWKDDVEALEIAIRSLEREV